MLRAQTKSGSSTSEVMKSVWQEEYDVWSKRSLADKEYVYIWADGIYSNVRLESDTDRTN